jgi:ABC-type phosphate transport system substrate-binding protein
MKTIKINILIIMILLACSLGYSQDYKVIVNDANSITEINKDELSDIFLKKTSKWSDNKKIEPVNLDADSDIRQSFAKSIHKKSVNAINAYWQKKIFTGKGIPPIEKHSDSEVIEFIRENPGAIGYISANTNTQGVKVVKVRD